MPDMADISQPAPFVTGELLRRHQGRKVQCVLKVLRAEGGIVTGEAADGMQVTAKQVPAMPDGFQPYVCVIGIADGDASLRTEFCVNCGNSFDMGNYTQLCRLTHGDNQKIFL